MKISDLSDDSWIKNWVLNCGVAFCSFYGDLYTDKMAKYLGKRFKNALFTYENGVSTQYLIANEQKAEVEFIVSKIEEDIEHGKEYCRQLKERTDHIMQLMDRLENKNELELDDFLHLQSALYSHVCPNFVIKRTADYFSSQTLAKLLHDFEEARLYTEPIYVRVENVIQSFGKMISKNENYDENLVRTLTFEEIIDYFKTKKIPRQTILSERTKGVVFWYQDGKFSEFRGKDYFLIREILEKPKSDGQLKGMGAFPGVAQGTVRIIMDPHKYEKFERGDILVTGMTRPEFLPIMEKAAAFVTDAGGVLSHAAIVARELKKPCVIGTTNATKVLKEGDWIEVNATTGHIKVLKNNNN